MSRKKLCVLKNPKDKTLNFEYFLENVLLYLSTSADFDCMTKISPDTGIGRTQQTVFDKKLSVSV